MIQIIVGAALTALALAPLGGQTPNVQEDSLGVGPGVTAPRLRHKIEPEYTEEALADQIQGNVVLMLTVDVTGRATGITVISPLGFGLDERAQAAVEKWIFDPGTKDGKPVNILATVEVNFRLTHTTFDERAEHQRTSFNVAIQSLKPNSGKAADRAIQSIEDLSRQNYPPAMFTLGSWQTKGEHVPEDSAAGLALIQKAASRNYGPALYEIAIRRIEGRDLSKYPDKGMSEMRHAAILGSVQAQYSLGNRYEKGINVPAEPDRARRYFRLCAAQAVAACQYRLAHLLLDVPNPPERDYVQAVAWYQLAAEQGLPEAKDPASIESARLTPAQSTWVKTLKNQLLRQ